MAVVELNGFSITKKYTHTYTYIEIVILFKNNTNDLLFNSQFEAETSAFLMRWLEAI